MAFTITNQDIKPKVFKYRPVDSYNENDKIEYFNVFSDGTITYFNPSNNASSTVRYKKFKPNDSWSLEIGIMLAYIKARIPSYSFRALKRSPTWRTDLAFFCALCFSSPHFYICYNGAVWYEVGDSNGREYYTLEDYKLITTGPSTKMYYLEDGTKVMPAPYPYYCDMCGNYTNHTLSLAKSPVYGSEWEAAIVCDDCGAVVTSIKHDHLLSKQIFNDAVGKIMTIKEKLDAVRGTLIHDFLHDNSDNCFDGVENSLNTLENDMNEYLSNALKNDIHKNLSE